MSRIRAHMTYANVVATVALFFAVGGGAAFATHLVVRSSDIVNGEVRGVDVSNANGGSLTGNDIRESTLAGVPSDIEQVSNSSGGGSESTKSATVSCPPGKEVVGATAQVSGAQTGVYPNLESDIALTGVFGGDTQAHADAAEVDPTAADWAVIVYARCATVP